MEQRFADLPPELIKTLEAFLEEVCAVSSASGDTAGLRRVAERLRDRFAGLGLDAEITDETDDAGEVQPVLLARGPAANEGRHLLLAGHLDTVLPAVEPRREGAALVATGALDMKGGLVALVGALELLRRRGRSAPDDLLLVAVPDEEVGGTVSVRSMRRWGEGARAALVLEPGEPVAGGGETLVAGRRGLIDWRLEVHGHASHSGLAYWEGRSALAAAAWWCAAAHALSRPGRGATVNVGRLLAGDADFVDNLARHHELVGSRRRLNVVPERAVAEGEVRFLAPSGADESYGALERLAREAEERFGVRATVSRVNEIAPVDPAGPGRELVDRAVALAAARGWHLEVEEDRGGISFPNFLAAPGLPVVDGLGPVGRGMHTRDEALDLTSLARRVVLLADLLATLS